MYLLYTAHLNALNSTLSSSTVLELLDGRQFRDPMHVRFATSSSQNGVCASVTCARAAHADWDCRAALILQ